MIRALGLVAILTIATGARPGHADDLDAGSYFPLRVGNWWVYEELDDDGSVLSRETWNLVDRGGARPREFHLRLTEKRLDALRGIREPLVSHEYLRVTDTGLRKRYPAGREDELDVLLLKSSPDYGTRWFDEQGRCEVVSAGRPCRGPRDTHPDCIVVTCQKGDPVTTLVTSIYARGVGMVAQELEMFRLISPAGPFEVGPTLLQGKSKLRLTNFHVPVQ